MLSINELEFEVLRLTLELYNNPVVPRNVVQFFIDTLTKFINDVYLNSLQKQVEKILQNESEKALRKINLIFTQYKEVFEKYSTEYSRFKIYEQKGLVIPEEPYHIDYDTSKKATQNLVYVQGYYIPLKWSLKLLLEIPGTFAAIMNYMEELKKETEIISDFVQGDLWKKKSAEFQGKIVFALFVYTDDFECGNALGSHAEKNKLNGTYISIANFPPSLKSKLSHILLNSLHYADDRKDHNYRVFYRLINDINELKKDGLTIKVDNEFHKVYFDLGLVLGDNLGLNSMLGFTESFATGYPCRICKKTRS